VTNRDILLAELEDAPEPLLAEVVDFVRFLKSRRAAEQFETALLSESALAADWLRPEEDDAWRDL
jgi:hypothetical protein